MKREREPDWARMAELVKRAGLLDVDRVCARLGIERVGWYRVEWLRQAVARCGLWILAEQLRAEHGLSSWDSAVTEAACQLRLNEFSVARLVRRDRARAREDTTPVPVSPDRVARPGKVA